MGFSPLTLNRLQSSYSINMNSAMIVLAALMAVVAADHQVLTYSGLHGYAPLGYSGLGVHPYSTLGYSSLAAPLTYAASPVTYAAAHVAAPVAYAAAPVASVPAPVAYTTGHRVEATYEPVEQHGYQIAY